jgi:hypothetical protein
MSTNKWVPKLIEKDCKFDAQTCRYVNDSGSSKPWIDLKPGIHARAHSIEMGHDDVPKLNVCNKSYTHCSSHSSGYRG